MTDARLKKVLISGDLLVRIMTTGDHPAIRVNGLPDGARFIHAIPDTPYNSRHGVFALVIAHESFPALKNGDEIPELEPRISFTAMPLVSGVVVE